MRKIPTLFQRDDRRDGRERPRVTNQVTPGCEWVLEGLGTPTRKHDGTCCLVRNGVIYKRSEVKPGSPTPLGFEFADADAETGKVHGWLPVGAGPEDRWHLEAFFARGTCVTEVRLYPSLVEPIRNGTYELCGPKIQGNPEGFPEHVLVAHGREVLADVPRDFEGLRAYFASHEVGRRIEGIVFWRGGPDEPMAKIKVKDFGFKRTK